MFSLQALEILFSIRDAIAACVRFCRDEPDLAQVVCNDRALQILAGKLVPKGKLKHLQTQRISGDSVSQSERDELSRLLPGLKSEI